MNSLTQTRNLIQLVLAPIKNPTRQESVRDGISLSRAAKTQLFQDVAQATAQVKVESWTGAKGENSSLDAILKNQGFDPYAKDANGETLVQRVAQANGLRNANLLQAGQQLIVPSKGETAPSQGSQDKERVATIVQGLETMFQAS